MSTLWSKLSGAIAMLPPLDLQAVCLYQTPPFNLSSKADPTRSYTMTGIGDWIISIP